MVLQHVAHNACFVVILTASFHADSLGGRDLNVIDVRCTPQGCEHAISQPKSHKILHRLFAEIVIDPIDFILSPVREQ